MVSDGQVSGSRMVRPVGGEEAVRNVRHDRLRRRAALCVWMWVMQPPRARSEGHEAASMQAG